LKAAPFEYERPEALKAAVELLARPEAKAIAGGQSLVPMMAMRLVRPRLLVDLGAIEGLDAVEHVDGGLVVGATARQRALETDPDVTRAAPLLAAALPFVGHREIRNRGTLGGSIAHADPSAELPLVAAVLGATLEVAGPAGERELEADGFVTGPFQTGLADGELLVRVRLPAARAGDGFAFDEVARRQGDFALCGVAAHVRRVGLDVEVARVGVLGAGPAPSVHDVTGEAPDWRAIGESVAARLEPGDDMHASASYRKRLAGVLVARCLERADAKARP
jgi:2-furoyl-CoA dehydrogenase FAD binding subunit